MIRKFVVTRINPILRKFGAVLTRADKEVSLPASLGRIRQKNIEVNTVIVRWLGLFEQYPRVS